MPTHNDAQRIVGGAHDGEWAYSEAATLTLFTDIAYDNHGRSWYEESHYVRMIVHGKIVWMHRLTVRLCDD